MYGGSAGLGRLRLGSEGREEPRESGAPLQGIRLQDLAVAVLHLEPKGLEFLPDGGFSKIVKADTQPNLVGLYAECVSSLSKNPSLTVRPGDCTGTAVVQPFPTPSR